MSALMGLAIDTMFGSIADRFRSMLLNLIMTVISWLEQLGIAFFDSAFVSQTLTFTKGISWLVLGAAFVVMLLDIGEELGGYRPGQGVEFTTIFTNFIKTIAFVLMAPDLAIIAMQLSVTATGQMSIDYDTFRTQANGVLLDTAVISFLYTPFLLWAEYSFKQQQCFFMSPTSCAAKILQWENGSDRPWQYYLLFCSGICCSLLVWQRL